MVKFLCLSLALTIPAMAETVRSTIHSYTPGEVGIIKLTSGRVIFTEGQDKFLGDYQGEVEIKTDDNNNLVSITALEQTEKFLPETTHAPIQSFEPTVLANKAEAMKVFKRFNHKYQRVSQCFNRAHVWAHEEFTKNNLTSMKAFLFFTNAYIVRHRFLWWFHVAPMFAVNTGGKVEHMVMDHRFSRRPQTIAEWKNMFVYSKRDCKLDGRYTDYDQAADQTQDCYWFTTPMYYWQPGDIGNEEQNMGKTEFLMGEVKSAYSEAF